MDPTILLVDLSAAITRIEIGNCCSLGLSMIDLLWEIFLYLYLYSSSENYDTTQSIPKCCFVIH